MDDILFLFRYMLLLCTYFYNFYVYLLIWLGTGWVLGVGRRAIVLPCTRIEF